MNNLCISKDQQPLLIHFNALFRWPAFDTGETTAIGMRPYKRVTISVISVSQTHKISTMCCDICAHI